MNTHTHYNLLDEIIQKRQAMAENHRRAVFERTKHALSKLSSEFYWKDIYFFGSIIQPGRFGLNSDVDIAIKGLNAFFLFRLTGRLSAIIERDVDIVRLEDNCIFKEYIIEEGVRWIKDN